MFPSKAIPMSDEAFFPIDDKQLGLVKDLTADLLGKKILQPHVVIASKIVDLNSFATEVIEGVEQLEVPFRHHILIFKPEVEDVP